MDLEECILVRVCGFFVYSQLYAHIFIYGDSVIIHVFELFIWVEIRV